MKTLRSALYLFAAAVVVAAVATGCSRQAATPENPIPASNAVTDWKTGLDETLIGGLSQLVDAERTTAIAQKICPVSEKSLGAMGKPLKVTVEGREVFLCCPGCKETLRANPQEHFSKLDKS